MATKAKKKSAEQTLVVTQVAGATGNGPKMFETLKGLGLGRIRATKELEDTPAVRGMIARVRHLVSVTEKKDQ
ncbi:MAG: 50S ribosomal protein L30 [Alphaproteobacteria bacterium]|nr:50S ribosomal protein L30 [Alphaproteobacteria bacterium]